MQERKLTLDIIRDFGQYLVREEKSTATQEKYLRDVRAFAVFLGEGAVTKEAAVAWKHDLVTSGYAVRSVNSMVASVNALFAFLGWTDCRLKSLRQQRQVYCPEEKELTKGEYLRLLQAAKGEERLQLVLQTICATGIRVSELAHFTLEAVGEGRVTVSCKGKTRTILVPSRLRRLLLAFARKEKIRSGPIFRSRNGKPLNRSTVWAKMKALCTAAGVAPGKVFPHNLRKLFARTFYAIEKDIAKLADILGHSSVDTTRIYIISTGTEHRKKIERLGLVL